MIRLSISSGIRKRFSDRRCRRYRCVWRHPYDRLEDRHTCCIYYGCYESFKQRSGRTLLFVPVLEDAEPLGSGHHAWRV